jgi:hypothetical protein
MRILYLPIEVHEQRYTAQWVDRIPEQLKSAACARGIDVKVLTIVGEDRERELTPGAFLNFSATNVFKATQTAQVARAFDHGEVKPGDKILVADAWHPGVINIRYMSDLLNIPVEIHALWHAGSYDPHDFLGRLGNKGWALQFERALVEAIDINYFATDFHIQLFRRGLGIDSTTDQRNVRTGWPMEYLGDLLRPYRGRPKRNLVVFPHRLAPEKQVEIFRDLAGEFPGYEFCVAQDHRLSKSDYHELLSQACMVFSASLQETLGIGVYEGVLCGAVPFVPDRLSYKEMYGTEFRYPSEWTETYDAYRTHKTALAGKMRAVLEQQARGQLDIPLNSLAPGLSERFFSGEELYKHVLAM